MKKKFKDLIKNNRWLKAVPNTLTLCNSLCGFAAILYTLRIYEYREEFPNYVFTVSAVLIMCAMVFDSLDGFAARIFNAASMHGIQMDSLADMVTFGVAPATLVAILAHTQRASVGGCGELTIYLLCSVYIGGAALRLATYNVHAMVEKKSSDKFSGLPSPGAAAVICCIVFWAYETKFDLTKLTLVLPICASVLGILMVSKIPYTHLGKWLVSVRRNKIRMAIFILSLLVIVVFRTSGVLTLVMIYIISGPINGIVQILNRKKRNGDK